MENRKSTTILFYLQLLVFLIIILLICIQIVPGLGNLNIFLFSSVLIVGYSLLNLVSVNVDEESEFNSLWKRYSLLLLLGMIFGSIGDFAMPGILLLPTDTTLLNGILFFGIGHIFYLIALRGLSPFLLTTEDRHQISIRNLGIWIGFIIFVILAFMLTVFDPSQLVLSVGALGYGIVLISAVAFAFSKWFDDYPKTFSLSLFLGFVFFFISDWAIAIRNFTDPTLFSGTSFVGVTYLIGQLLIHSALLLGFKISGLKSDD